MARTKRDEARCHSRDTKQRPRRRYSRLVFPRVYLFRPAYIHSVEPRQKPNFRYRLVRAIYPAFRLLFPNQVIRADDLARAMGLSPSVEQANAKTMSGRFQPSFDGGLPNRERPGRSRSAVKPLDWGTAVLAAKAAGPGCMLRRGPFRLPLDIATRLQRRIMPFNAAG